MMTAEKKDSTRKVRKRDTSVISHRPYLDQAKLHAPLAARSYGYSVLGMIPLLGLILGPLAVLLGGWGLIRGSKNSEFRGTSLCVTAILLGLSEAVTQWIGLVLMIRALSGD